MRRPRAARPNVDRSAFAGFRFPPEVITLAVRWYLRYGLSYRDVEELLAERGIEVDHVTVYRWVQRFTPLFADAARPLRHACGDRWFVDETYVKVAGQWRYLYRAVDQYGQIIDVLLAEQRDTPAARRFFARALRCGPAPAEVTTDQAHPYLRVLDDLVPATAHLTEQYENNPIESDHARLKARLRPMRGLKQFRSAARIAAGHAFVQNLRRGHWNSPPTPHHRFASRQPSPSSRSRCDQRFRQARHLPGHTGCNRPGEGDTIPRHPDLFDSLIDAARDPVAAAANVAELQALISPFGTRPATRIRPDDLRRVTVPTLMIWGDHDPVVSVADAEAAAKLIPGACLEVLPAGHVPQLGNPHRVAKLLEDFATSCA